MARWSAHNLILEIGQDFGLAPGIFAAVLYFYMLITAAITLIRTSATTVARSFAAALLMVLTTSLVEASIASCYQYFLIGILLIGAHLADSPHYELTSPAP